MASLARVSTLSFPLMQWWLGHHAILTVSVLWVSSMGLIVLWKFVAKIWAACGLGSAIARTAAVLSVKKVMWVMFGWLVMYSVAWVALIDRAAISTSYTSV